MVNNMSVKDRVSQFEAMAEEDKKEAEKGGLECLYFDVNFIGFSSSSFISRQAASLSLSWK